MSDPATLDVFCDGPLDGATNMARDEALLRADAPASLRVYAWSPPTISLGYFQRHEALASLPVELRSLDVVRRLTGGGAILHDREITYCLVLSDAVPIARKAPAELYRLVHECWRAVLADAGVATELAPADWPLPSPRSGPFFCFETPGQTDLLLGSAKVLGSAQRRTAGRVLQHGSLILDKRFAAHPGAAIAGAARLPSHADEMPAAWVAAFVRCMAGALHLSPRDCTWSADLLAAATELRPRYAGDAWTRLR